VTGPVALRHADRVAIPWKNGGGILWDVASHDDRPEEPDAFARFLWRVSIAEVAQGGPFSVFPGVDRTLAVLSGHGMRLSVEGRPPVALSPESPALAFPGDAATTAELVDGPILDLNVMVRRGKARATLSRLTTAAGGFVDLPPARLALLRGEAAILHPREGEDIRLGDLDAVLLDDATGVRLSAPAGAAVWLVALDLAT
jgi:hypothetical protein